MCKEKFRSKASLFDVWSTLIGILRTNLLCCQVNDLTKKIARESVLQLSAAQPSRDAEMPTVYRSGFLAALTLAWRMLASSQCLGLGNRLALPIAHAATCAAATLIKLEAPTAYELPPLPYDYLALEPTIDAHTMCLHHDMHHGS